MTVFFRPRKKSSSSTQKIETPSGSPVSPSTQTERGSPVYPVSPVKSGDSGESGESPRVKVDDRSSDKPLARTVISGNDGRKVTVSVYKIGEVENIEGDKIVRRARLKFVLKYADLVRECTAESGKPYLDCGNALREIAKATHYSVSRKALIDAISELRNKYGKEEAVSLVDYVRKNYPDRLAEIEKDPFKWVLERTKEIVGYERLKLLTFLSLVSSQMERVSGMSRVHIMLVGPSGVGKSSTVKSVLRLIEGTDIYFPSTRLTPNALGYLDVNSFDGKVLFIEQIDKQILNYLREMMTEGGITTYVTEREVDETGRERFVTRRITIPGQAVVITTSVADNIDIDREQLFNRFLKVYVNPKSVDSNKVIEAIWLRKKSEVSEVDKRVFLAYLLSRPKFADTSDLLERAKAILKPIVDLTGESVNRTAEVLRNLTIATAIARGKTKVENEDFEFVLQHFQLDVLYNGLGLSERDIEFVTALPNEGSLKTSEVADKLRVSKQYALNVLKNLERKGVVEGRKEDGKTFSWTLTPLGKRIKSLVNAFNKGVVEVKDEKGGLIAEAKFRPDDNGGGGRGNAVPVNDGGGVPKNEGEDNRVDEAYQHLKRAGWVLVDEFVNWYGEDVLEALKRKDLVTFNEVDGKLYVTAK